MQWAQANYPNTVGTQVLTGWPASNLFGGSSCPDCADCPSRRPVRHGLARLRAASHMVDTGSFNASQYYNALQYNFRLDQYFTDRDRLYLSYYNDSFDQQQKSPRPQAWRAGYHEKSVRANRLYPYL